MPKTPNLGLELTTLATTKFKVWRESVNGEGEGPLRSNAQIIDDFARTIYGVSGSVTLPVASWVLDSCTFNFSELGSNDAIFFTPVARTDKVALESASLVIATDGANVTFTAEVTPVTDISLEYFISRGRANE